MNHLNQVFNSYVDNSVCIRSAVKYIVKDPRKTIMITTEKKLPQQTLLYRCGCDSPGLGLGIGCTFPVTIKIMQWSNKRLVRINFKCSTDRWKCFLHQICNSSKGIRIVLQNFNMIVEWNQRWSWNLSRINTEKTQPRSY